RRRELRAAAAGQAADHRRPRAVAGAVTEAAHPALPAVGTLVIGGGIVGLTLAGFLAAEGVEVAVIDDGRVGGTTANAGSLHVQMQSRFMRLYPDLVPGLESTLHLYPKAVAFWRAFEAELGADFDLKITGGLLAGPSAARTSTSWR